MDSKLFNFLCDGGSKHHPQVWIRLRCMSLNRGRINSVGRALNCRVGGRGFDSRDRTNTPGLKIAEEWRCFFCPANGWTFAWLGWILNIYSGRVSTRRRKNTSEFQNPRFQNEAKYTTFLAKISFICMRMKNHFRIKGWALNLVLIQKPGGTRK